jgi:hypothetical protein
LRHPKKSAKRGAGNAGFVKEKIKENPKGSLSGYRKTVMYRMENNLQGGQNVSAGHKRSTHECAPNTSENLKFG